MVVPDFCNPHYLPFLPTFLTMEFCIRLLVIQVFVHHDKYLDTSEAAVIMLLMLIVCHAN